jgi:hypothetical protein
MLHQVKFKLELDLHFIQDGKFYHIDLKWFRSIEKGNTKSTTSWLQQYTKI